MPRASAAELTEGSLCWAKINGWVHCSLAVLRAGREGARWVLAIPGGLILTGGQAGMSARRRASGARCCSRWRACMC